MTRAPDVLAPDGQPGQRGPAAAQVPPRQAYWEALAELAADDDRIVCLDSDLGGLRQAFRDRFPGRYIDAGIAEANLFSVAAGLAAGGYVPFVHTMAAFATSRAAEQLKLDIAGHGLPVRVIATHGGLSAAHFGPTHYALEDLAVARSLPGLAVVVPAESGEIRPLLHALHQRPGPGYLRLGRAATPAVHGGGREPEFGRALELRPGDGVSIIACGPLPAGMALEAARALASRDGTAARVLEVHTLVPLDEAAVIRAASQTAGIVTVEEHRAHGGLGDAVSEVVGREHPCPVARVAVTGLPRLVGGHRDLLEECGVSVQAISDAAGQVVNLRGRQRTQQKGTDDARKPG